MKDTWIVVNSFVHDVATGTWLGTLLLMGFINRKLSGLDSPIIYNFASDIINMVFYLAVISFVIVLITGMIRGFTFKYYGWTGDVAKERKNILWIKHAILGTTFVVGMIYQVYVLYNLA